MQNYKTNNMQNRKTNVCSRLFNWLYCLASVACAVVGPRVVYAHQAPDRALDAVRLEDTRPQIDGVLDDSVWQQAPIFTGFVQREPEEGQPASEKTTVQLAYDDEALYVGIMAYDSAPEQIVSRLVRRDQWTEADWIQVSLDTHHDHQTGYAFAVYAGGSIYDAVIKDYGWDNDTWNGVWESAQVIGAEGWSVEFAIPFHNLRFSSGGDWGINVARYISRKKEQDFWVMVPRKESGSVSRFAHLEGLADIESKRTLELLPYSVGRSTVADARELFGNAGADLRYGLSSNMSLNATINPDFGQVEADPAELNLSVFETFQDERRPFFVADGEAFKTPIDLFYSRRIGRQPGYHSLPDGHDALNESESTTILGAAKLTGKTASKTTFGLLTALTAKEYARVETTMVREVSGEEYQERSDFLVEPRTHFLVGRVKQDLFAGNSHVGLLGTAVQRDRARNAYTGGVDWTLKWRDNGYAFWGQLAGSRATVDDQRRGGLGNMAVLSKNSGWLRGELWWEAYSRHFEIDDLGFQWRSDFYNPWLWIQLRKEEDWAIFRRNFYNFNRWGTWNFDRTNLQNGFDFNTHHQFKNYWWVHFDYYHMWRSFDDLDTRGGPLIARPASDGFEIELESDDRFMVSGWVEYEWEDNSAGSTRREVSGSIRIRPTSRFEISLRPRYSWNFNDAQWVENFDADADGEDDQFVYGELDSRTLDLTTRANILFSRDLSLEFYVQPFISAGQYANFKELAQPRSYSFVAHPGPEESPDFRNRSLHSNAVLRWEYKPGSTLFIVWSQFRHDDSDWGAFRPGYNLRRSFVDEGTNIFLVKLNYWLNI